MLGQLPSVEIQASFQVANAHLESSVFTKIPLSALFPHVAALLKKADELVLWAFVGFGVHLVS